MNYSSNQDRNVQYNYLHNENAYSNSDLNMPAQNIPNGIEISPLPALQYFSCFTIVI